MVVYTDDERWGGTSIANFVNSAECSNIKCIEDFSTIASITLDWMLGSSSQLEKVVSSVASR